MGAAMKTSTTVVAGSNGDRPKKKPPGVKAKKVGKPLDRGAALQIMTYPRPRSKSVIVEGARLVGLSVSSFMVTTALREAAVQIGRPLRDLVPEDEIKQYA
jgi:hypothetical protein